MIRGPVILLSRQFLFPLIFACATPTRRTRCEGRISVVKRRHGLNRCRYRGEDGMKRWAELGVISDNLINIGRAINEKSSK
jgi:hypothetical protein